MHELLISNFPDPEAETMKEKFTPLHFAARYVPHEQDREDYEKTMKYLVVLDDKTRPKTEQTDQVDGANRRKLPVDVNCKSKRDGATPLHYACLRGNDIAVEILLSREGIELNKMDNSKETPLHEASLQGHTTVVKQLLDKGAILTPKNEKGELPLHTPLHLACIHGHVGVARELLDRTESTDAPSDETQNFVNMQDVDGNTALFYACESGNLEMVEYLLDKYANVKLTNENNVTPLHVAARCQHMEVAEALIKRMESVDADQRTPLKSVDVRDADQRTPLHYAAQHNKEDMIGLLLEK